MHLVSNQEIADELEEMGDLVELSGGSEFRARAYHAAARAIGQRTEPVAQMVLDGADLKKLPGVGESIASKIEEIARRGHCHNLDDMRHDVAPGLPELLKVPGLGAARVRLLNQELGVCTREQLYKACAAGKVSKLPRFGKALEQKLLHALAETSSGAKRFLWDDVELQATRLLAYLERLPSVRKCVPAGSFRRHRATVGDLDILVDSANPARTAAAVLSYEEVAERIAAGTTKVSVVLKSGLQVDVRIVPAISFGAALCYFTGSKSHNVAMRDLALRKGLMLNEYGLYKDDKRIAGQTEESVFAALGLAYIPPEMRENSGEIEEAAEKMGGKFKGTRSQRRRAVGHKRTTAHKPRMRARR